MELIVIFIIAVALMIVGISKLKIHPFLAIMTVSLLFGLLAGIPLVNRTGEDGAVTQGIVSVIGAGFSGTFTSIGIVIILGALIGAILEATGAAFKLADMVIKVVGDKHPVLAMQIMGWVVSIPVFCDSGFVILDPIRKALVRKTHVSGVAMAVALSSGLYAAHVFIPPTPGPIAAANALGVGHNLLLVMVLGTAVSVPALIGSFFYARFVGSRVRSAEDRKADETARSYDQILAGYGTLPNGAMALAPIIIPIALMALGSVAAMAKWTGGTSQIAAFLGAPIIALSVGLVCAIGLLASSQKMGEFYAITNETLKIVGPILFITASGGVLGRVIAVSGMVGFITANAQSLSAAGIVFPFLLSAILKSAQGSSTVALSTAAGIAAPLLPVLGLDTPPRAALAVIAIGAGAMTVSHANDSYFWVVTNFSGMTPDQGYKTQTVVTLIEGLCALTGIVILSFIL
ncbi:MAG: GntP family permease [Spirochaetaceae bacterium]|jgi:GntP family gluconate:H+ symporter|nr:GntP family permease [Spirochaetaceae bacterium]